MPLSSECHDANEILTIFFFLSIMIDIDIFFSFKILIPNNEMRRRKEGINS